MAQLLYRLGQFSARRHWLVITSWLAIIALAGGAYALFGGAVASSISIPGTDTARVIDALGSKVEGASGGSGTVVFRTQSKGEFTAAQRAAIERLMNKVADRNGVEGTQDPFALQSRLDDQRAQLRDSATELADGRKQLDDGRKQIADGRKQLAAAQGQLNDQKAATQAAGLDPAASPQLVAAQAQLDAQRKQLDASAKKLDASQTKLDDSQAKLADGQRQLELGQRLADLSKNVRFVNEGENVGVGLVQFKQSVQSVPGTLKEQLVEDFKQANIDGVQIYPSNEISESVPEVFGTAEALGLVASVIVLLVLLGTAIGASLPLAGAIVGVGVAMLGSLAFSGVIEFVSVTPVLGVMLGLAVGIDYSLFILNRHRRQLKQGVELHESIGLANGTSGTAVVFAGTTVGVALLALNVTAIPFLSLMGTVGAAAVVVAILVAVTLTPALLSLAGMRILRKSERKHPREQKVKSERPMGTLRAVATVVAGVAVLGAIALPATQMRLGLPTGASSSQESDAYKAYTITASEFGAGQNGALLVVADLPRSISKDALLSQQVQLGERLAKESHVVSVVPIGASKDRATLAFQIIPSAGPTSVSTETLVQDLRAISPVKTDAGNVKLGVAGNASANIDIAQKLANVLPTYLAVVIGLSLLILVLVFRSILVPLTATAGFVLSLLATFGGLTAIFQLGFLGPLFGVHDPAPIIAFLPIIAMGVLFGLAMDYQLFLVSGMREAFVHGAGARVAVRHGVNAAASVVVAAALIMISVFAGFAFSDSPVIRPIGFGLAFGVLVDAFVVRLLIIPATMHLLGPVAWWFPKWLDRLLPNVDVEGASLERHGLSEAPVASQAPAEPISVPEPARQEESGTFTGWDWSR